MPLRVTRTPRQYVSLAELVAFNGDTPTPDQWETWVVDDPIVWKDDNGRHEIGGGFLTDFASIPRVVRWLWTPSGGPWRLAGIVHDWAYSTANPITRPVADRLFLDIAAASGVARRTRTAMWLGLRIGGRMAWRNNRRRLNAQGPRWRYLT